MAWKLEVFWQIATALQHLSDKNLTHGNLKASNVLLFTDGPTNSPQPLIKLADPGVTTSQRYFIKSGTITIYYEKFLS
jgi:serine/threonine protein kinase